MSEQQTVLYKLTDKDGYTRRAFWNATKWKVGTTHTVEHAGSTLCSSDVIHAYTDPYMAVIMNSTHAAFKLHDMRLFKASGEVVATDGQRKVGVKSLTIIEEMPLPAITIEQKDIMCTRVLLGFLNTLDDTDFNHDRTEISQACCSFLTADKEEKNTAKLVLISTLYRAGDMYYPFDLMRHAYEHESCVGLGLFIGYATELNLDYISMIHEIVGE